MEGHQVPTTVKSEGNKGGGSRVATASGVPRMVFAEIVGTLSFLQPQADDDISDRLHYYYTTTFLLLTAVLISLKMFGGRPIECWLPAEYKSSWEDYTEMYCWARNTYFAAFDDELPEVSRRENTMVSYYQWVPFFLVVVAFMFYSPCLLWRLLYDKSGIRLKDIMGFANDKSNVQPAQRRANINGLAAHLSSIFKHRFRFGSKHPYHHKIFKFLNLRFYEAYLTFLYLGIKFLFLINVLLQMFLLSRFLEMNSRGFYGYGLFFDLVTGKGWKESPNFPVVTYCDMQIRILGQIFFMLWLWYSLLAVVSFCSIISWIFSSLPFEQRKKFVARRLELADVSFKKGNFVNELEEFVRDYVKMDGVFVLKMITIHSGVLICTEVVDTMWDQFLAEQGHEVITQLLDEGKEGDERAPSGLSIDNYKRKTSVLVPLVSREDLSQPPVDQYLRPPSSRLQ
ncbi:unnamed protein product [Caenorhabditis auriculariae]|uniref:Innexin n=1 Tax=Caenorhabditis auriculariae TaxID=2777116 RepID=A0A8S1HRR9_9PELO|nr:unnamed protein product [Caenorhabditis auriculariae]